MKAYKHLKKALMWHKVKELWSKGLNKSQISQEVGIHRKTVRHYLEMNEEEFYKWIGQRKNLPPKLQPYYDFVKEQLEKYSFLSASQIEDRLKEHFSDLPQVHSKTVYNFVQSIRSTHQIAKPKNKHCREFEKREETAYGDEAQVDFGVSKMLKQGVGYQKVWIFAMVLSRSRQKFVYFQTSPFTTSTSIYAHQLAFEYYQGVPRHILYDQDRVFMVDENLGDLILTSDFQHYVKNESFEVVFCRKADPQTKGKIENVIKYVKYNFLRGREFANIDRLNQSASDWLERTGNGKKHSSTRLVPQHEWLKEKEYLLPIKNIFKEHEFGFCKSYTVLKDHTISYKGNFYSLPIGTYKGKNTKVLVSHQEDKLAIQSLEKDHIATHTISILKGKYIRNSDHTRDKTSGITEKMVLVINKLGNTDKAKEFIEGIRRDKPRYLNDNLRLILFKANLQDTVAVSKAIDYCLENNYYNALKFTELITYFKKDQEPTTVHSHGKSHLPQQASITPATSKINTYEKIIQQ
jgi:transposase